MMRKTRLGEDGAAEHVLQTMAQLVQQKRMVCSVSGDASPVGRSFSYLCQCQQLLTAFSYL